ncbi:MAG: hypothetical protein NC400_01980 [Clostridium sp.]|nr:hypothetical protein [Clostridium sp.]
MESLKTLDLASFNEHTDNYICTHRNWIGIPTSREYRVFSELQQPALIKGKHYKRNYSFAQKLMENLSWKITDVIQLGGEAQIEIEITNVNIAAVADNYTEFLLENMEKSGGIGIVSLISDLSGLARNMEDFTAIMDSTEDTCTTDVTLFLQWEDGKWKLHISEEFINAFMGNIDFESYPE